MTAEAKEKGYLVRAKRLRRIILRTGEGYAKLNDGAVGWRSWSSGRERGSVVVQAQSGGGMEMGIRNRE